LSFTGSGPTGSRLLHASADRLRPTSLELGGKGALIVFEDADVESALDWAMVGIFVCSGQVCSATSRLLIHDSLHDEFLARLKQKAEAIVVGDPLAEGTQMGPMVSEDQYRKVVAAIELAQREGCTLLSGGRSSLSAEKDNHGSAATCERRLPQTGFYVEPTILTDVPLEADAWRNEIFGPVLCVQPSQSEAEAVAIANNSPYGLANAVLTRDEVRAERVARQLQSGVVWKNCNQVLHTATPFGGVKQSGFGREYGIPGLEEYVQHKTVIGTNAGNSWNWYG